MDGAERKQFSYPQEEKEWDRKELGPHNSLQVLVPCNGDLKVPPPKGSITLSAQPLWLKGPSLQHMVLGDLPDSDAGAN